MTTSLATVSVDLADPTPPFEQLRRQLAGQPLKFQQGGEGLAQGGVVVLLAVVRPFGGFPEVVERRLPALA